MKNGYFVLFAIAKLEYDYGKIRFLKTSHYTARNASMKHWSQYINWIYQLSKSQTHRRRADNTQGLIPCCYRLLFIQYLTTACPARRGKKKTVAGQFDFVRSFHIFQRRFWEIKAAVSLCPAQDRRPTEGAAIFRWWLNYFYVWRDFLCTGLLQPPRYLSEAATIYTASIINEDNLLKKASTVIGIFTLQV